MPAWIYARVSTAEQLAYGQSLEGQVRACRRYCETAKLILTTSTNCDTPGVIIDGGKSAYRKPFETRPGAVFLAAGLRPGDTVVVTSLTRLFRRVSEAAQILERWVDMGVNVTFVDYPSLSFNSANGRCLVYCMAAVAQLKSELISARVREAKARKLAATAPQAPAERPHRVAVPPSHQPAVEVLRTMSQEQPVQVSGRTLIYARVSTDEQSVDTQLSLLRQQHPGALEFVDHGVSAWKTPLQNRPAGKAMLAELQPGDVVAVLRPDRIFRSLKDASIHIDIIRDKGAYLSILESGIRTDDLFGRLLLGMLSAFAQMESEETSRATKHALQVAIGDNETLLQYRLPRALSKIRPLSRTHYAFADVFTLEEASQMWHTVYLTRHQYRSVAACVSYVANSALHAKGLPPVTTLPYMCAAEYARSLRRVGTAICNKVAEIVDGHALVSTPVNSHNFHGNLKTYERFMAVYRQMPLEHRSLSLSVMFAQNPPAISVVTAAAKAATY